MKDYFRIIHDKNIQTYKTIYCTLLIILLTTYLRNKGFDLITRFKPNTFRRSQRNSIKIYGTAANYLVANFALEAKNFALEALEALEMNLKNE